MPPILTARWPLPATAITLASVIAVACGNKGDLFLPATLEDERRLQRIETGPPEPSPLPGQLAPDGAVPQRSPPGGSMPAGPLDPDGPVDPDDPGGPGTGAPRRGAGS